jgi:hypothetical protein
MRKKLTVKNPFTEVLAILREEGKVATVQIEYNGSGDDGCINDTTLRDAAGVITKDSVNTDIIEQAAYDLLEDVYAGWENNEGGEGKMTLNVKTGVFEWTHGIYVTTTEIVDYKQKLK